MKKILATALLLTSPWVLASGDASDGHTHEHSMSASAAGQPAVQGAQVAQTIDVSMGDDMRFTPHAVTVKSGETVRFFIKNTGKLTHEFVIGTEQEIKAHAEMMKQMPGMEHSHGAMLSLKGGQRGALVWTFGKPGHYKFACTLPGHLEAGMTGDIQVQ